MATTRNRRDRRAGDTIARRNYPPTDRQRRALATMSGMAGVPTPSPRTVGEASREIRRLGALLQHPSPDPQTNLGGQPANQQHQQ